MRNRYAKWVLFALLAVWAGAALSVEYDPLNARSVTFGDRGYSAKSTINKKWVDTTPRVSGTVGAGNFALQGATSATLVWHKLGTSAQYLRADMTTQTLNAAAVGLSFGNLTAGTGLSIGGTGTGAVVGGGASVGIASGYYLPNQSLTSTDSPTFQGTILRHDWDASNGGWGWPMMTIENERTDSTGNAILNLTTHNSASTGGGNPFISFGINGANGWGMGIDNATTNDDFCLGAHIGGPAQSKLFWWTKAGSFHLTPIASAPANPVEGDIYFGTDHNLHVYSNGAWRHPALTAD